MARRPLKSVPNRDRPREKMRAKGPGALSDKDLAAILIGSGIKGRDVLKLAGEVVKTLKQICRAGQQSENPDAGLELLDSLSKISGIGPAKAAQITAAFELARRYSGEEHLKIRRSEDIIPLVSFIANRKQEHLVCVSLNGAHEVIATRVVTIETINQSMVHPREVFADPLSVDRAAAVILAHNHPSGSLEISAEDRKITKRLREAAKILGIELLDHLIITSKGHRSILNTATMRGPISLWREELP